MSNEKKNKWLAFIAGDASVTLYQLFGGMWGELGVFGLKVLATIILGIAGGLAGLAGKDLYNHIKSYLKTKNIKP